MAGIGEASAIIAVAQVGIKVSKTIFEFVGEVKDAPKEIRRIGRDICTTSERLEEIGRLIDNNNTSRFFNQGGIASAVRCSNDCQEIITQVNGLLAKGGWVPDSKTLEKKDFDISLFDALRWPFVRSKLASPQADLEKVKASLSLLFNSVMATASSNPMQSEYALQIPKLKKWAEQATRRAENEKRRSRQVADSSGRLVSREVHWKDQQAGDDAEDPEMRQKFIEFQVKLVKEGEERRAQERAAYIQAQNEAKRKAESEAQRRIELTAVELYKQQQEEIRQHKVEKEQKFKEELAQLGLEPEKIQSIIETTGFQELEQESAKQNTAIMRAPQAIKAEPNATNGKMDEPDVPATKAPSTSTGSSRPWLSRNFSKSRVPSSIPGDVTIGDMHNHDIENGQSFHSTQHLQLWLVDLVSGQNVELAPSREWLRSKIDNARYDEIAHKMAKLKHPWRTAILDFLRSRNDREPPHMTWKLCFIGLPRRVSKLALFGHRRGDCLVRLVLWKQKVGKDDSIDLPPWTDATQGSHDVHTPSSVQTNHSLKSTSGSLDPGLKSALKHSRITVRNRITPHQNKLDGPTVSFAQGTDIDMDQLSTIEIEMEMVGDKQLRGTTTFDSSLFPPEALVECGVPWRKCEQEFDGKMREVVRIPEALSADQLEQLLRITVEHIIEGKVPWQKRPAWRLQQTYKYLEMNEQPSDPANKPETHESSRDQGELLDRPETDPTNIVKPNNQSERLPDEDNIFPVYSDVPPSLVNPAGQINSQRAESLAERAMVGGLPGRESSSRRTDDYDIVDVPLKRGEPSQEPPVVQEIVTHHRHIDHGYERDIPLVRRERDYYEDYETRPPLGDRDVERTVVRRYEIPEPSERGVSRRDSHLNYRPAAYRDREEDLIIRERERPRIVNTSSRGRERYEEEDFRTERRRSRDIQPIIIRQERPRERDDFYEERRRPPSPRYRDDEIIVREWETPREEENRLKGIRQRDREDIKVRERERSRRRDEDEIDIRIDRRRGDRDDFDFDRREDRYRPEPILRRDSYPTFADEKNRQVVLRRRGPARYEDERVDYVRRDFPIDRPRERETVEERIVFREREQDRRFDDRDRSREEIIIRRRDDYQDEDLKVDAINFKRPEPPPFISERSIYGRESQRDKGKYREEVEIITGPSLAGRLGLEERLVQRHPPHKPPTLIETSGNAVSSSRDTYDAGQTNEDIISTTLGEFTTYNANPEETAESPTFGLENSFTDDPGAPSYATNLKSAQRKLDELFEKLDKATKEGDFVTASDLRYYAIPEVKTRVEELKAQDTKIDGLERIEEVEDSEQASAANEESYDYRNYRNVKDLNGDGLQPRVVDLGSDGDNPEGLARRETDSTSHSWKFEEIGVSESNSTIDETLKRKDMAPEKTAYEERADARNGAPASEEIKIVRRPTATPSAAAVEDSEEVEEID